MTSDDQNQNGIARRDFIKQAAVAGTVASASEALVNLARSEELQAGGQENSVEVFINMQRILKG